ncbi:hypothetical protein [Piscinibacter sp.]|uniref:hypothetical protein n=1 Tax=Piscinibacter sp. TaxID=1903157 RepID=UPI002B6888F4|nr:hypothetical protein [Albitalea sp.]HUG23508.1 hypothetical protein [Albitalea sp.]
MGERKTDSTRGKDAHDGIKLELVGLTAADEQPKLVVQALDAKNGVLHAQEAAPGGRFTMPGDVLKRAHRVVLGAADDKGGVRADASVTYRAGDFMAQVKDNTLALAEGIWSRFKYHWACVSGSVQACRRRPWWYDSLITAASSSTLQTRDRAFVAAPPLERFVPSINDLIQWPYRCAPVCLGTIEVYRRSCCCWPIVIDDLRIDDLIRDLGRYVERLPKFPPPKGGFPPPPPPPIDPLKTPFFKGGALNEFALNAANDLAVLRSVPRHQAVEYVNARAYLVHRLCSCSAPVKVASGTLQPDGSFNICWPEPWRILLANCYEQYAYVVKQTIGSTTTTIYDGLAAGAWFAAGDAPTLTTYSPHAFTCNETGTGDGDAYVFLDLIGDTESHELTTPASTGWDRVAAPNATSGLLFPNVGPNDSHLRNLGGAIELSFVFSLGMRDASIGAHYYRVSVCRADAHGHPTGPRHYYGDGLAWQKIVGADIVPDVLGPVSAGGESHLYRIPYADEPWVGSVRYHALINTLLANLNVPDATDLASPASNHLVTLEVFNAAGERLRPLGSPASGQPGTELAEPFKFRRWFQPGGSIGDDTVEVPYAALTHLFCWDNRPPVADITRLVMDGNASDEECQFLEGPADSTFAIEYSAYVPDQRFQYRHGIGWLRGLNASAANGGVGTLPTPLSPTNVGKPPALPVVSGSNSFELMLTRLDAPNPPVVLQRCSFAVTLTTLAKTTNGENLNYPHAQETAAFALAIDGPDA